MTNVLTCRWTLGTLDRVRITTPWVAGEVHVAHIVRLLGRNALEGLYLRGSYVLDADEDLLWDVTQALFSLESVASAAD
ncbi:hypothetical protein [Deinococcus peraridilitoris]|uniref:Uncharacterized protein n=1 Tax=Deinococcus peraridilitoris (strain DSM 19664 / LMG 22246 / CIP 109416 / KR-200) TaxID=937777 RepID=K9ZX82_DEIPD|nr:hypothetical protein [Deinococcus peraridilitoris]AFZ66171.1 hypothetical protein Deipe_0580 [Deinococcus peraridilitoris DSM 19664]